MSFPSEAYGMEQKVLLLLLSSLLHQHIHIIRRPGEEPAPDQIVINNKSKLINNKSKLIHNKSESITNKSKLTKVNKSEL